MTYAPDKITFKIGDKAQIKSTQNHFGSIFLYKAGDTGEIIDISTYLFETANKQLTTIRMDEDGTKTCIYSEDLEYVNSAYRVRFFIKGE